MIVSSSSRNDASSSSAPAGVGINYEWHRCCSCFETLLVKNEDRHSRPRTMHKLWDEFSGGTLGSQPLFELFRLILPHLDTVRPQYRLKQKGLANMYVSILAISESSEDAQTLLNWKKPSSGFQRNEQGNFPEVVHSVIETRMKKPKDLPKRLTIGELNAALDKLAEVQSTDEKKAVLDDLTKKTTAREQRWILRVILKDMQIGMKEDSIFRELHPDAKELYASVCDLRSTCQQCVDPSFRLNDITICLFKPMKPRLAHRANSWMDVHKNLSKKGEYGAEYKLDGERLVLHFLRNGLDDGGDRAEWYSRNSHNATANYAECMAPVLKRCLKADVRECIVDGEMMVWNKRTGDYETFGSNRTLADWKKREEEGLQPCYVVFDVLWINGKDVMKEPLRDRREKLSKLVEWEDHSIELSECLTVRPNNGPNADTSRQTSQNHNEEVMMCLDRAMARGYEGVMFKSLESAYAPGARDNEWIKLKPDYVGDMRDDLDLIILAGYYGDGKRGGAISHFLLGVAAPSDARAVHGKNSNGQPLFYPFCKCGTGYTRQRLAQLREELAPGQHKWNKHSRPSHLCGWVPTKTDDEPDVWFEPAKSLLMTVKGYEIVKSTVFLPCEVTLRFPRCERIREDKPWSQCETYQDIQQRVKDGKAKVAAAKRSAADVAREETDGQGDAKYGKKGKAGPGKQVRAVGVNRNFKFDHKSLEELAKQAIEKGNAPFQGEVCVVRGFGDRDEASPRHPNAIRIQIASLGGTVDANFTKVTTLIVDADEVAGNQIRADVEKAKRDQAEEYDIVTARYVLDVFEAADRAGQESSWSLRGEEEKRAKSLVPLEPRYIRYAKPHTELVMRGMMDEWGDRYKELATEESLDNAMGLVKKGIMLKNSSASKPVQTYALALTGSAAPSNGAGDSVPMNIVDDETLIEQMSRLPDADYLSLAGVGVSKEVSLIGVVAYAPRGAIRIRLSILGAAVTKELTAKVTHAVLPAASVEDGTCAETRAKITRARVAAAEKGGGDGRSYVWIVGEAWLTACESQGKRIGEEAFALKEAR